MNHESDLKEIESAVEALLLIADQPISRSKLKELVGPELEPELFETALRTLSERYQDPAHGIEVAEVAGGFQLRTKPAKADLAKKLAKVQTQKLSGGAMETLAIVAYRQPVMKEDIDKIRGVDSSYFIHGLLDRGLIEMTGRSELPGRPILYATTRKFLELFGLRDLQSLPPLRELEEMIPASQTDNPEDPVVTEMQKLVSQMNADGSGALDYDPAEDEALLREIRERIGSIRTSTATIDEQKAQEKASRELLEATIPGEPAI